MHSPTSWEIAWRELEALYNEGSVRAIGVSNFSASLLRELLAMATVPPVVVQNWMDPFNQDKAVRSLCAENGEGIDNCCERAPLLSISVFMSELMSYSKVA